MYKDKNSTLREQLKNSILDSEFGDAKEIWNQIPQDSLEEELFIIAEDTGNIGIYLFVQYLIFGEETAFLHGLAFALMATIFVYLPGAYFISYHHILRAIELEPEDYTNKEGLLFFYRIPDQLLSEEKALEIAKEILKTCPDNITAKNIVKEIERA